MSLIGFRYLFGIHMGISRGPVDELIEIKVGDKTAWRGSIEANSEVQINVPELFGGERGEGGIVGKFKAMFGDSTQTTSGDPDLATVLMSPTPGFRRMFTCFFDGVITMMNPYPKPWKFRVRRAINGWDGDAWYPEKAIVSLTRPASVGEIEDSTETKIITETGSGAPSPLDPLYGPWVFEFPAPDGFLTITSMYLRNDPTGTGEDAPTNVVLFPGADWQYELVDDIVHVTLYLRADDPGGLPQINYTDRIVYFDYTKNIDLTVPTPGSVGEALIQAMNPVHIIYEALTNREWGRGLNPLLLDDAAWKYAADQCFEEKFGMCIRWTRTDEIRSFIQTVLDHVGGTIFDDRKTGLIRIRLIRDDYVKSELPLYEKSTGLLAISDAAVSTQDGMVNELKVTYRDPVTDKDRTVRKSNLAAVRAAGGAINSISKSYPGIPTAELALRVATRDLRALSPSLRKFSIILDRRGYNVTPGSPLRIQDLDRSLPDQVIRVGTVDYGKLGDGQVKIEALLDIFGLPNRSYTTIGPPLHLPPKTRPCVDEFRVFEMSYRSMYRQLSAADLAYVDNGDGYLGVVAKQGQKANQSFVVAVRPDHSTSEDDATDGSYFCPT